MHENVHSTQQKEINEAIAVVVSKHNNEIGVLQEEIKLLIKIVENMNIKLKTLEEAKNASQSEEVEVLDEIQSERQIPIECEGSDYVQKEPEVISEKDSDLTDGKSTKKLNQWIYCEICKYKCKSDTTLEKHIMKKHKNAKKCTICDIMCEDETVLKEHMEKEHSHCSSNISDTDLETRMEQLQQEINAEYGENMSDVSLDEERFEALDREMNPGDYA